MFDLGCGLFKADYRQIKNKPLSDIEFRPMQAQSGPVG
jgi:hypothetical protein